MYFSTPVKIADYFTIKCPQFNYTHLPSDDVVKSRISQDDAMIIMYETASHDFCT